MRNIYYTYRVCKHVLDSSEIHLCKDKDCKIKGVAGTPKSESINRAEKKSKKPFNKLRPFNTAKFLIFEGFAIERGFVELKWCDKEDMAFFVITESGIELTDNLLLPFTPIGLWKEIWKEHKIIISVVYTAIVAFFGGTLYSAYKLLQVMFGGV